MSDRIAPSDDTIFALAAGGAGAALSVIRISGRLSAEVLTRLTGRLPPPREARLRPVRAADGDLIDRGLALWFPAPGSATGEAMAELHLHGGGAIAAAVAVALSDAGARPAEPGEFTRRAFLNGRLDLTEAEAVGDLVAAETEAQRRQALRQLDGALSRVAQGWRARLIELAARQEAAIDFPDDVPDIDSKTRSAIATLRAELDAALEGAAAAERVRGGLVFAVVGAPNAGKSTLVNALADREVAIVTPYAGTTRDVLEARLVLGGVPVTLLDTAGLRETSDPVEAEGVRRARSKAAVADLVLEVIDGTAPVRDETISPAACIEVWTKADLWSQAVAPDPKALGVSAASGEGMERLRSRLIAEARRLTQATTVALLTNARQRAAVALAASHLAGAAMASLPEITAEELRLALSAIGRLTGEVGVEEILDSVFARFCIGK